MFQLLKIPFKEWGSEQALNPHVFLICAQLQYNIVAVQYCNTEKIRTERRANFWISN